MTTEPQSESDVIYVFTCKDEDGELVEFITYDPGVYDLIFDEDKNGNFRQTTLSIQGRDHIRDVDVMFVEEMSGWSMRDWERKIDNGSAKLSPVVADINSDVSCQLWEVVPG